MKRLAIATWVAVLAVALSGVIGLGHETREDPLGRLSVRAPGSPDPSWKTLIYHTTIEGVPPVKVTVYIDDDWRFKYIEAELVPVSSSGLKGSHIYHSRPTPEGELKTLELGGPHEADATGP